MSDVVILREISIVHIVEGAPSGPIVTQMPTPGVEIFTSGVIVSSQAAVYQHTQSISSAVWTVNHNLGGKPSSIMILNTGGQEIEADIIHTSDNQFVITFTTPQTGLVRVSP